MFPSRTNCYLALLAFFSLFVGHFSQSTVGAETVSFYGYSDCLQLKNKKTRVILCPAAGGRVLEYSLQGKNALYLTPEGAGAIYKPGTRGISMSAGRFDIGPEQTIPKHPQLWMGRWKGESTGPLSANDKRGGCGYRRPINTRVSTGSNVYQVNLPANDQEHFQDTQSLLSLESHFRPGTRHLCNPAKQTESFPQWLCHVRPRTGH